MRFFRTLAAVALFALPAFAQDTGTGDATPERQKHAYQSDVARLRKIVINSLYSHRDIFLRELISNANDAVEKLRLTALKDKSVWDGANPLNITIKAYPDEDGKGGKLVITDTGIGMSPEELTANLGTLAKSGTSEFLARAEGSTDTTGAGNLIGAFGLGFYSSFLVADRVSVASVGAPSANNPNPSQHIFTSHADEPSFEVYPDPRGNTLGRGTEITLELKPDALEYLDQATLTKLVNTHSVFSTQFPIYLWTTTEDEILVDEDGNEIPIDTEPAQPIVKESKADEDEEADEDDVLVEDVEEEDEPAEKPEPKTKKITIEEWTQLNTRQPIWIRDPKDVTEEEYDLFYQGTFKDYNKPLAWHHFTGDSEGLSFRALLYIPSKLPETFWQAATDASNKDIRLMVKRVFITSDLGEEGMPKWASIVKVIVDADDLPLNVSRETLQNNKFMKQIKNAILRHLIQLMNRLEKEEPEKFAQLQKEFGGVIKLGAVEDFKNRQKLASLARFHTNQRANASLDEYLENKKEGQKQIFYLAEIGKTPERLARSVFIEKLTARGYEVLLLGEPMDEIMVQNLQKWKGIPFQDVAKAGLKFGDEWEDDPEEKKELQEKFKPLLDWLKWEASNVARSVVVSDRLVTSPCAIVADVTGYTANVEKLMSASNKRHKQDEYMAMFAKKQRVLEINPRSPLMEGLLRSIEELPNEVEGRDIDAENELKEVTAILIDGALVRSGYEVPDSDVFFERVDKVLRRSLGVSETAPTPTDVKPAPPVDPSLPEEAEAADEEESSVPPPSSAGPAGFEIPEELRSQFDIAIEEIDEFGNVVVHDEL